MRIKLFFILFLLVNGYCFAQILSPSGEDLGEEDSINKKITDTTFQLLQTIPINSTYLIADNLQNVYIANEKGQVIKFDKSGKQQFEYNNNRLGAIGKIDVRNPLTMLVYYPDLEVVVILDRTLSPIKELNLYDLDIIEPKGIALANDNNIWVYDEVAAILKKISQTGEILFESRNLNQLTRKNLSPTFLLERNNLIYLSDSTNGLFIFDNFGQLKQEIPVKRIERFQVEGKQVFFWRDGKGFVLETDVLATNILTLPTVNKPLESVYLNMGYIYLSTMNAIEIYDK